MQYYVISIKIFFKECKQKINPKYQYNYLMFETHWVGHYETQSLLYIKQTTQQGQQEHCHVAFCKLLSCTKESLKETKQNYPGTHTRDLQETAVWHKPANESALSMCKTVWRVGKKEANSSCQRKKGSIKAQTGRADEGGALIERKNCF